MTDIDLTQMTLKQLRAMANPPADGERLEDCHRCGGEGGNAVWNRTGYTCYKCEGLKKLPYPFYEDETLAQMQAANEELGRRDEIRRQKRHQKSIAAAIDALGQKTFDRLTMLHHFKWATYADLVHEFRTNDALAAQWWGDQESYVERRTPFGQRVGHDLYCKVVNGTPLSEKQIALIDKCWDAELDRIKSTEIAKAKDAQSEFVGELKERRTFEVTVQRIVNLPDYGFGASRIFIMRDENDNVLTWKTGAHNHLTVALRESKDERKAVAIKGTIKDHTIYRDTKQTVLTRCVEA